MAPFCRILYVPLKKEVYVKYIFIAVLLLVGCGGGGNTSDDTASGLNQSVSCDFKAADFLNGTSATAGTSY